MDCFSSEEWLKRRDAAAKSLSKKTYKTPTDKTSQDADDVLDFFETIGYLLSRGALDEKMVWHTFFHWIMGYCQAAEEYISMKRQREPKVLQDLIDLHHRMEAIESYEVPTEEFRYAKSGGIMISTVQEYAFQASLLGFSKPSCIVGSLKERGPPLGICNRNMIFLTYWFE